MYVINCTSIYVLSLLSHETRIKMQNAVRMEERKKYMYVSLKCKVWFDASITCTNIDGHIHITMWYDR